MHLFIYSSVTITYLFISYVQKMCKLKKNRETENIKIVYNFLNIRAIVQKVLGLTMKGRDF